MKLSEAILLGSVGTPQAFGRFYNRSNNGTCAMGAALAAIGKLDTGSGYACNSRLVKTWPWAVEYQIDLVSCPVCNGRQQTFRNVITHLNDAHCWPRPQIAAWVATIEPQEAPVQAFVPEPESVEML